MKRIIALLLALVFAFSLVACASDGEGNESTTPPSEDESTPTDGEGKKHDRIDLPYIYPMSDGMKYLIEDAWEASESEKIEWFDSDADVLDNEAIRYYGLFGNGYYILFEHIGWDIEGGGCVIDIAGESFRHSEMFEIYGYKDEEFTPISMLYENGLLEFGEIMVIADIHAEFEKYIDMYANNK